MKAATEGFATTRSRFPPMKTSASPAAVARFCLIALVACLFTSCQSTQSAAEHAQQREGEALMRLLLQTEQEA